MKIRFITAITIIWTILFASSSFGQSRFLEEGENGFGIGLGFQNTTTSTKGIGLIDLGYSFDGMYDLGVKFGKSSDIRILASYLNLSLTKQDKVTPFTFNLMIQVELAKDIRSSYYRGYGSKTSSSSYSIGGIVEHKFSSKTAGIIPFISLHRTMNDENTFISGGGFSIFAGRKTIFALNTGYFITNKKNIDIFIVSLSIMFKNGNK